MLNEVNLAHSARAEESQNPISGKGLTDQQRHGAMLADCKLSYALVNVEVVDQFPTERGLVDISSRTKAVTATALRTRAEAHASSSPIPTW